MNNQEVKSILIQKGINQLYHANSVLTALTYLRNGGLISRQAVEVLGLSQTPQESDELDRELGIYNDIFFDSVDIHQRAKTVNHYGPITFVYNINVLDELSDFDISITKDNPIRWSNEMLENDRYFQNIGELTETFVKGNFQQHITIRKIDTPLTFKNLEKIVIDNPNRNEELFNNAINEIKNTIDSNNLNIPIEFRDCPTDCKCKTKYAEAKEGYTYHRFKTSD